MDIMAEAMGAALADDLDISDSDDEDGGGGANDQGSVVSLHIPFFEGVSNYNYPVNVSFNVIWRIVIWFLFPPQNIDDKTVVAPAAPPLVPEPPPPDEDGIWF